MHIRQNNANGALLFVVGLNATRDFLSSNKVKSAMRCFYFFLLIRIYLAQFLNATDIGSYPFSGSQQWVSVHRIVYETPISLTNKVTYPAQALVFSPMQTKQAEKEKEKKQQYAILYMHPTAGVSCQCSTVLNGTLQDKINNVPSLQDFITLGYTVVEPDYYGFVCPQTHPYLIGAAEALSVLYAMKALHIWKPYQYSTYINIYGFSQGGQVTLWTQHLAKHIAPELSILVAGAISPPTNLSSLIHFSLQSYPGKYLASLGLFSWPIYYPELHLNQIVLPNKVGNVQDVVKVCVLDPNPEGNLQLLPLLGLNDWLKQDPTQHPFWLMRMEENSVPPIISSETLVFQGQQDELVKWQVTQAWAHSVPAGSPFTFYLEKDSNHHSVMVQALPIIVRKFHAAFQKVALQTTHMNDIHDL